MADLPPYPGTPRWVTVSGTVIGGLVMLVAVLALAGVAGPHGPGRHASPDQAGSHAGWGLLALLGVFAAIGAAVNWSGLVDRWPPTASTTMAPQLRKPVLMAHIIASISSLGAVAVFLLLAIVGLSSTNGQVVRAAYIANELIAWYVILPLILAALAIGIIQSLGTPWGLFRHYWVLAKLLLTVVTIYVLLQQMDGISHMAGVAADGAVTDADLLGLRRSMRMHAAGGLVMLLLLVALSIYKPRGMTRYGWRKQHEQ
ncbi:hypothetical protein [Dongia deserti]|uniref:hypothetical protein n=1 Tax=Dongia deserti TaxID=2268030 RepID=UPI002548EC72|nr:hypothetical protein [Dongia deserti]